MDIFYNEKEIETKLTNNVVKLLKTLGIQTISSSQKNDIKMYIYDLLEELRNQRDEGYSAAENDLGVDKG